MSSDVSLSPRAHMLMYAASVAFGLVGLVMFLAPGWSADNFAWNISPMVAMTMGAWYLGGAAMSGLAAYHRRLSVIRAPALYVSLFGLTEAAVLLGHWDRLRLGAILTWPYIIMMAIAIAAAVASAGSYLHVRARLADEGALVPLWVRAVLALFAFFVAFLALVALVGSAAGLYGGVFPEPLSLLTLQSFGAFYLSLSLSMLVVVTARSLAPITVYVRGGMVMLVLITIAAFAHWGSFNLALYPRQVIYLAAYLAALVVGSVYLWDASRRRLQSQ